MSRHDMLIIAVLAWLILDKLDDLIKATRGKDK